MVIVRILSHALGYGLKCYQCASTKGWDDCASIKIEATCVSGLDRCIKVLKESTAGGVSVALYGKSCGDSQQCTPDTSPFCKSDLGEVKKCEINCCSGDLCNGGKVPMVSAMMLLACALVAFLR